jgi:predicted ribosome quality control (RQC) complex YloA/Tae2 family protein
LVSEFNLFPALAEEAVLSLGLAKESPSEKMAPKKMKELHRLLSAFFSSQKPGPVLAKTKTASILLPFPLPHWQREQKAETESLSGLNAVLDSVLSPLLSQPTIEKSAEQSKRLKKLLFSLEQQKKAVEKLEKQSSENQQKGEWVYENYSALEEIKKAIETAEKKGYSKKQILETFQKSELKGFELAKAVVDLDLRKKTIVVESSA